MLHRRCGGNGVEIQAAGLGIVIQQELFLLDGDLIDQFACGIIDAEDAKMGIFYGAFELYSAGAGVGETLDGGSVKSIDF